MRETQPMRCDCDLNDVTYICPCGEFLTVSGPGKLLPWIEEHRPHTNGLFHCERGCLVSEPLFVIVEATDSQIGPVLNVLPPITAARVNDVLPLVPRREELLAWMATSPTPGERFRVSGRFLVVRAPEEVPHD